MFNVICTSSLENANDIEATHWEYADPRVAIQKFDEKVKEILQQAFENELLNVKMSIYRHKALIRIESRHYVVAMVQDNRTI